MTPSSTKSRKMPVLNRLELDVAAYRGAESTLCNGCGHDSITNALIKALFEYGVRPHQLAKLSGIGCSSKTTAYFVGHAHGFNSVHGRMAAVAIGAHMANHTLTNVGVSGDGDTASIGLGHFLHAIRRNPQLVYIIENNGCYGLTKGQFSATADRGSQQHKGGAVNRLKPVDICSLAIEMGCGFVARSFSGDARQLGQLLKAAVAHHGTAVLDVVSPCVTFSNHEGSTKSYVHAKEHEEELHEIGFVPFFEEIAVEYDPGTTRVVELHDHSKVVLKKLDRDHDPTDRARAISLLHQAADENLFLTGLIYLDPNGPSMAQQMNLVPEPLATLPASRLRPPASVLAEVMEGFK